MIRGNIASWVVTTRIVADVAPLPIYVNAELSGIKIPLSKPSKLLNF